MGEEVDARVVQLRTTLCESARTIVHEQFPAKIEAMTQLVKVRSLRSALGRGGPRAVR